MKDKWQVRYALWSIKPKRSIFLTNKAPPWWLMLIFGILFSLYIFFLIGDGPFKSMLAEPITQIEKPDFSPEQERYITGLKLEIQASNVSAEFFYKFLGMVFKIIAVAVFVFFGVCGLLNEERKGYKLIIERLENELMESKT